MGNIEQLPVGVINKIAAGEVIERPASVIKELMENSIDAGAARIDVSVEKGGSDLVRVTDTGSGIAQQELLLAVASHATSKLRCADDLYRVSTLGFRGEALASIASVSHLTIRSRTAEAAGGAELDVVGGDVHDVVPCGCPQGTMVEVRNLFFNTPVRRKFLRTPQTEMSHATEAFTRIALAHCEIHWSLSHNGRVVHDLPATSDWRSRIARFFGTDLADALIPIESTDGDVQLSGYVANPTHSRANNRLQYLLLNGRAIRDRSLQHALSEAYRGLLLTGRYPICFLRLSIAPDAVDVNVHPTKAEVRFLDSGRVYGHLLGALRTKFLTTDLTPRVQRSSGVTAVAASGPGAASPLPAAGAAPAAGPLPSGSAMPVAGSPAAAGPELTEWVQAQLSQAEPDGPATRRAEAPPPAEFRGPDRPPLPSGSQTPSAAGPPQPERVESRSPGPSASVAALQIHNRYLVAESDDGVVVFDQHALHERVLYEQLRAKVLDGAVEAQSLLVPEPVDLTAPEAAAVLEHRDLLAQLGVEVKPFGGATVLICAYPAMLANMNPAEVLRGLVDHLMAGGKLPDRRDLLEELLQTVACKAAIKAGDRLTADEIRALLQQRHLAQDSHHCPHGRPTSLIFTRAELDRQFKRT
jgi:DNA mismatch repair protein MutL